MELTASIFQQVQNGAVTLVQLMAWALAGLFFITTLIGGLLVKVVNDYLKDNRSLHKEHEQSFDKINSLLVKHDVTIEYHKIEIGNLKDKVYTVKYPK